jgi:hypothetical protein
VSYKGPTVNSISVTNRQINNLEATRTASGGIDVSGEYVITLKNGGYLPILTPTIGLDLGLRDSAVKLVDEQIEAETIQARDTLDVSFEFRASDKGSRYESEIQSACSGSVNVKEELEFTAIFLSTTFNTTTQVSVKQSECDLTADDQPENRTEQPEPEPQQPMPESSPIPPNQGSLLRIEGADPENKTTYTVTVSGKIQEEEGIGRGDQAQGQRSLVHWPNPSGHGVICLFWSAHMSPGPPVGFICFAGKVR